MKKTELAYIAGLFDGEGCIHIAIQKKLAKGNYYALQVSVGNTQPWVCQMLKFAFGGYTYQTKPNFWIWLIRANKAMAFLQVVIPYLRLKKAEAEIGIRFQSNRARSGCNLTSTEYAIYEAERILMKSFKQKHKS